MADAPQHLEGIAALYESTRVRIGAPSLYCDSRAAVHLTSGSSAWHTKALITRIMGAHSLIHLGHLQLAYTPTREMQADALTKFMPHKTLQNQRKLKFAGVDLPVTSRADLVPVGGIPVAKGPRIVLGSSFAVSQEEILAMERP